MIRSRLRALGAMLVVVAALGVLGVSSASAALPELVNKNGTELTFGFFTTSTSTQVEFEGSTEQMPWYCANSKAIGLVTGVKTAKINITYTGCDYREISGCHSPGQASGTVKVNPLVGKLVYLDSAHTKVGWALEPATKNGVFAEILCGGFHEFKVGVHEAEKGGLDTLLVEEKAPYKVKSTELTPGLMECWEGAEGNRSYVEGSSTIPGYLEVEHLTLKGAVWENFCLRGVGDKMLFEEEVELKA